MPFHVQLAQALSASGFPEATGRKPAGTQTFPVGTPVQYDTTANALIEHPLGATVTNILGISAEGVNAGKADNPDGEVNVYLANRLNVFMAKLTDNAGVILTPTDAHVNREFGLRKNGSGLNAWWSVNAGDTTNTVVEVIGYDLKLNVVFFKFKESAIQQP